MMPEDLIYQRGGWCSWDVGSQTHFRVSDDTSQQVGYIRGAQEPLPGGWWIATVTYWYLQCDRDESISVIKSADTTNQGSFQALSGSWFLKQLPEHHWSPVFTVLEIRKPFKRQLLLKITLMLLWKITFSPEVSVALFCMFSDFLDVSSERRELGSCIFFHILSCDIFWRKSGLTQLCNRTEEHSGDISYTKPGKCKFLQSSLQLEYETLSINFPMIIINSTGLPCTLNGFFTRVWFFNIMH